MNNPERRQQILEKIDDRIRDLLKVEGKFDVRLLGRDGMLRYALFFYPKEGYEDPEDTIVAFGYESREEALRHVEKIKEKEKKIIEGKVIFKSLPEGGSQNS